MTTAALDKSIKIASYEEAAKAWADLDGDLVRNLIARGRILADLHEHAPYAYERFCKERGVKPSTAKRLIALAQYPQLAELKWLNPDRMLLAAGHYADRMVGDPKGDPLKKRYQVERPIEGGEARAESVSPTAMTAYELDGVLLPALVVAPPGRPGKNVGTYRTIKCKCPECGETFDIIDRE